MATYIHEPLPDPNQYIRLLEVIKLDDNEVEGLRIQVHCRLTVWPLQGLPSYSALSYTWGDERDSRPILVDGKVMLVSRNCEYALKQAKEYSGRRQRYLWCDAICIIQKTDGINVEKNHQVRLMGEVYRGAKQVLACIGEHGDNSEYLLRVMRDNSTFLSLVVHFGIDRGKGKSVKRQIVRRWVSKQEPDAFHELLTGLTPFLNREYFSRLWIYQELQLGRQVMILCGEHAVSMRSAYGLFLVLTECTKHTQIDDDVEKYSVEALKTVRLFNNAVKAISMEEERRMLKAGASKSRALHDLPSFMMQQVLTLGCKDPRDKVYGTLALVNWNWRPSPRPRDPYFILPDYEMDRFDLGMKVLELGIVREIHIVQLPFCYCVATNLELASCPTEKLSNARRRRHHRPLENPPPLITHGPISKLQAFEEGSLNWLNTWQGFRCNHDGEQWYFTSSMRTSQRIAVWPERCELNSSPKGGQQLEPLMNIVLPSIIKEGDWCLFGSLENYIPSLGGSYIKSRADPAFSISQWIILVVRHDPRMPDSRFEFVGKGIAYAQPGTRSNVFDRFGLEFDDCWDLEDALVFASSFPLDVDLASLKNDQLSDYMETGICEEYGSSFVECCEQDMDMLLMLSNNDAGSEAAQVEDYTTSRSWNAVPNRAKTWPVPASLVTATQAG